MRVAWHLTLICSHSWFNTRWLTAVTRNWFRWYYVFVWALRETKLHRTVMGIEKSSTITSHVIWRFWSFMCSYKGIMKNRLEYFWPLPINSCLWVEHVRGCIVAEKTSCRFACILCLYLNTSVFFQSFCLSSSPLLLNIGRKLYNALRDRLRMHALSAIASFLIQFP